MESIKKAEKWVKELSLDKSKIENIKDIQRDVMKALAEEINKTKDVSACAACNSFLSGLERLINERAKEL